MITRLTSLYVLSNILSSAAFLALAVLVYLSRRSQTFARHWIAFCVLMSATTFCMALSTRIVASTEAAFFTARVALTFAAATTLSFLAFALAFVGRLRAARGLVAGAAAAALLLVGLFWGSQLLIQSVERTTLGLHQPVPGPLMPLYLLFVAFTTLTPVVLFIRAYRASRGRMRLQLGYMLTATVVIGFAAVGSLIPTVARNSVAALLPTILMVIAPSLVTYAIIRHQLWDIRTVIHKTALWLVASSIVMVPVWLLLRFGFQSSGTAALAGAAGLLVVFGLHFRLLQPWLDHRFARRSSDSLKLLDRFNRELLDLRSLRELAGLLESTLQSGLCATAVNVFVETASGQLRRVGEGRDEEWLIAAPLRGWLQARTTSVDIHAVEDYGLEPGLRSSLEGAIASRAAVVLVPLVQEGRLLAVVTVGEKQSLRAYTREDFQVLERIRPPATAAMANALLYDRLQELTSSLESRVEQRTRELQFANEQLHSLDRAKTKFFTNITHELRTPLTLILAPLEDLLLRHRGQGELAEDLQSMHRSGLRLLRHINGLLDLAQIDAGEYRLSTSVVNLNKLAGDIVRSFRAIASRKGVALAFTPLDGDDAITGDAEKLDLVISNLLANAVKFTPAAGAIAVAVLEEEGSLVISVRDSGIGIPEEQLDRIFDRFAQVDGGATRRFEGAGIGLSLVKEVVGLHQGNVAVSSLEGKGSEFRVRLRRNLATLPDHVVDRRVVDLPTRHARRAEDRDPVAWVPFHLDGDAWVTVKTDAGGVPATEAHGPRVVIVEDNPDMLAYLARRLGERYAVTGCINGSEALRVVADRPPDVLVSDVMMPGMSGFELCRRLKSDPLTAAVPIILITAHRGVGRTLEGFQSGADDYLTKPFNFQELQARIEVQLKLAEMQRRLARQEKGDVFNLVAAGLAHEVRNPVNAVLNAARPLKEGRLLAAVPAAEREAVDELLSVILEAAQRIDRLIADFLNVARPHVEEVADWKLGEALDSAVRLLRHKHGREITLHRSLLHSTPVFGRTSHLNQVLMNLLDNAVRAAGPDGAVWLHSEQSGGVFRLRVRDSGPGIPRGLEERIFDPLFTTQPTSDSTGLGLYITRRVVEEHGGRISLRSRPGEGAEFTVEIPLSEEARGPRLPGNGAVRASADVGVKRDELSS